MSREVELLFVRLYLGKQRMEVGLFDPVLGGRRLIKYRWFDKVTTGVPPENWYKAILGEVEYQRTQELNKAKGRFVPKE